MEKWFMFTAFNSQTQTGYGTDAEADKYCDFLNRGKDVGLFTYRELDEGDPDEAHAIERLNSGDDTDGFRLDDALDAIAQQDELDARRDAYEDSFNGGDD